MGFHVRLGVSIIIVYGYSPQLLESQVDKRMEMTWKVGVNGVSRSCSLDCSLHDVNTWLPE